jgi:threonine aldolase
MNREEVMRACTRFWGHAPRAIRERLLEIAAAAEPDEYPDRYGGGALLETFEREIAELLGKEAAVFMPSGTMAQQIALRIHCDRRNAANVALHPLSHLVNDENSALTRLHRLQPIEVGDENALYTLDELKAIPERLGAVLLELPERNIGGALRPWNEVEAISTWARERGTAMHLDGARLWESQPFYGMPLAQIAGAFDTVYVSFYKILNAVAGAALAGPADAIAEARGWQWRHGGRLIQQYPMVVSARDGLHRYLPRVPLYCERARRLAATLSAFDDVAVTPNPPPTNMMHVYVRRDRERLNEASLRLSSETGIWLAPAWQTSPIPGWHVFELTCGEGALEITDNDARGLFERLLSSTQ